MTKPSYEELVEAAKFLPSTFYADRDFAFRVKQLVRIWQNAVTANATLESELARVRGLLQRYVDKNSVHNDYMDVCAGCLHCESVKLLGAESADIGKRDTADKSGKVNRVEEKGLLQRIGQAARDDRNGDRIEKILDMLSEHEKSGSAETGGEKA